jgi:Flp pilus assembly protein TadB
MNAQRPHAGATGPQPRAERRRMPHLMRWCIFVGVVAAATILLLYGLSAWTLLAAALLIACPAVIGWVLIIERDASFTRSGTER